MKLINDGETYYTETQMRNILLYEINHWTIERLCLAANKIFPSEHYEVVDVENPFTD